MILRDVAVEIKSPGGRDAERRGSRSRRGRGASSRPLHQGTIDIDTRHGGNSVATSPGSRSPRPTQPAPRRISARLPTSLGWSAEKVDLRVGHVHYDPNASPSICCDLGVRSARGLGCLFRSRSTLSASRDSRRRSPHRTGHRANGRTSSAWRRARSLDNRNAPVQLLDSRRRTGTRRAAPCLTPAEFLPL